MSQIFAKYVPEVPAVAQSNISKHIIVTTWEKKVPRKQFMNNYNDLLFTNISIGTFLSRFSYVCSALLSTCLLTCIDNNIYILNLFLHIGTGIALYRF